MHRPYFQDLNETPPHTHICTHAPITASSDIILYYSLFIVYRFFLPNITYFSFSFILLHSIVKSRCMVYVLFLVCYWHFVYTVFITLPFSNFKELYKFNFHCFHPRYVLYIRPTYHNRYSHWCTTHTNMVYGYYHILLWITSWYLLRKQV